MAGVGNNETYDESVNMHRFDNDEQISVIGQANDINKQNFTPEGGAGGRGGGGGAATTTTNTGVTTVWAGGANYRNSFGPNTRFLRKLFLQSVSISQVDQNDSIIKTIQGQPGQDSSNTTAGIQSNIQRRQNHRLNFNLEQRFRQQ